MPTDHSVRERETHTHSRYIYIYVYTHTPARTGANTEHSSLTIVQLSSLKVGTMIYLSLGGVWRVEE